MTKKLSAFCLIIFLIFACQKQNKNSNSNYNAPLKSQILNWMNAQKANDQEANLFIDTLIGIAQWENLEVSSINNREHIAYMPAKYNGGKTVSVPKSQTV
jgi:hypothetical protein